MDISCDIIRDLLPLYAEDLTSQASKDMVDEHLCGCDECTKQLGILKKAAQIPVDVEVKSLKRVGNIIRRRRVMAVMTALLVVVSILASVYVYMNVPIALTAEEAVVSFLETPDGGIKHTLYEYAFMMNARQFGENKGYVYQTTRSRMQQWEDLPYKTIESYEYGTVKIEDGSLRPYHPYPSWRYQGEIVEVASELNHWYLNIYDGTIEQLLWDGGAEQPEDVQFMEPNPILLYLLVSCAAFAVGLAVLSRLVKKAWAAELMQRFAILCGSIAYSTVVVCGNRYICLDGLYELAPRLEHILCLSVVVTLTGLFVHRLYKLNKQDKGE